MKNTKMGKAMGYFVPEALAANTDLTWNDKAVYASYHYFTFYGRMKTCTLTVKEISKRLGISERAVKYSRSKLKECGFISTDGGIKTKALVRYDGEEAFSTDEGEEKQEGGAKHALEGGNNHTDIISISEATNRVPPRNTICTLEVTNLASQEGTSDVPIIKNTNKDNKERIKNETTVTIRDSNLPLEERIEIPVEGEVEKEQSPQRSTEELNKTLLQELKGCSTNEVAKRFDKFLVSIRNEKFIGKEGIEEVCLRTFLHVITSERVRDVFREIYEETKDIQSHGNFLPIDYGVAEGVVSKLRRETSKRIKELRNILQGVGYSKNVVEEITSLLDEDLLDVWEEKHVRQFLNELTVKTP